MGFFKDRKRAKELENNYNEISKFKNRIQGMQNISKENIQELMNKCEEILLKVDYSKQVVSEDLKKSRDLLMNAWFATRDALADEYNIHQKRLAILVRDEGEIIKFRDKLIEMGAKKEENKENNKEEQQSSGLGQ